MDTVGLAILFSLVSGERAPGGAKSALFRISLMWGNKREQGDVPPYWEGLGAGQELRPGEERGSFSETRQG
jgi:hypothetical protein